MLPYLKIIRPVNLLLIVFVQCVIKFGVFQNLGVKVALDYFQFFLLVLSTVCIAAAGNVVNDIFDEVTDRINKPEKMIVWCLLSERAANNYYIMLSVLGVGTGFYLANSVGHPGLAVVFIIISALLYLYASQLKSVLILSNLLVSLLVAMSLIVLIIFDIFPAIDTDEMDLQVQSSQAILAYAGFAFYINLIREIVKDLQDIDGDKNAERNTIPIAIGRDRTVTLIFSLGLIGLLVTLAYTYFGLYSYQNLAFYFVFLIAAPLLVFCIRAWSAATKRDFGILSLILKIILFLGVGSLLLFAEIIPSL